MSGRQKSRLWAYICLLLTLQQAGVVNTVADEPRPPYRKLSVTRTSLIVSGGVDCGRRRRNIYDKKPQRYAKDNKTAHLAARSDKSVAYVTNNKRLLDVLYCRSYDKTWSIARPLCDSRATCFITVAYLHYLSTVFVKFVLDYTSLWVKSLVWFL